MIRYLLIFLVALGAYAQTPGIRRPAAPATPVVSRPPAPTLAIGSASVAKPTANANIACGASPHCAVLSWVEATGSAVTGFNVYRGTVSSGPYVNVGSITSPTITSFTDLSKVGNVLVEGAKYFWVVTALCPTCSTVESGNSNEASGTVPFQAPQTPSGLVVSVF